MSIRFTYRKVVILTVIALTDAAGAQVFKWTDESGKTHYGDRKDAAAAQRPSELKIEVAPAPPLPPLSRPGSAAAGNARSSNESPSALGAAPPNKPNGRSDSSAAFFKTVRLPVSSDPEFGRSPTKPVRTGPRQYNIHLVFLNSLRGPAGEPIEYVRKTSCCMYEDKNLPLGNGMLDVYELRTIPTGKPDLIYIDMYRNGPPMVPTGFTQRKPTE